MYRHAHETRAGLHRLMAYAKIAGGQHDYGFRIQWIRYSRSKVKKENLICAIIVQEAFSNVVLII